MLAVDLKKYIYENNKIEYVLDKIGCTKIVFHNNEFGGYYSAARPDGDNPMGCVINNNQYLNYGSYSQGIDFSEQKDIFDFVQKESRYNFSDAVKYLHEILDLPLVFKKSPKREQKRDILGIFKRYKLTALHKKSTPEELDLSELDDFVPTIHEDLFREGVIKKTVKKFDLMYSYKRHRNIFPMRHWATGEIIGLNQRTIVKEWEQLGIPKYFITRNYKKNNNLYGLWENRRNIKTAEYIVLYEAEKSVLKRDSRNDSTGVAISGHVLSDEQARILIGLDVMEVVIAMDKDVSLSDVFKMAEKLYKFKRVSFIYDKNNKLGEHDSPADASNDVFWQLFKERIPYNKELHNKYIKMAQKGK